MFHQHVFVILLWNYNVSLNNRTIISVVFRISILRNRCVTVLNIRVKSPSVLYKDPGDRP